MNTSSTANSPSGNTPSKPGKLVSFSFLIVVLVLGVGAYYVGPSVMAYYFLWTEQGSSAAIPAANVSPEGSSAFSDRGGRGFGGGEALNLDPAARAKRRPPAEFDDEPKPSGEETVAPIPKS